MRESRGLDNNKTLAPLSDMRNFPYLPPEAFDGACVYALLRKGGLPAESAPQDSPTEPGSALTVQDPLGNPKGGNPHDNGLTSTQSSHRFSRGPH
jgi:hypothetical protein